MVQLGGGSWIGCIRRYKSPHCKTLAVKRGGGGLYSKFDLAQSTENREQSTENRAQRTENREQRTENREYVTGSGTYYLAQRTENREYVTGSGI